MKRREESSSLPPQDEGATRAPPAWGPSTTEATEKGRVNLNFERITPGRAVLDWSELESGYAEHRSGLIVPERFAQRRPKGLDLFSGCGGFSLGMMKGGFEIVGAADNDTHAAITYLHNLGQQPVKFWWVEPEDEQRMEKALQKSIGLAGPIQHRRGHRVIEPFVAGGGYLSAHPDVPGVRNFFFGDIAKLKGEDILRALGMERGELDCVCGSPPCQGFSFAGKRNVLDPRNSLVFEFVRLVIELHPKTMVFENVPGIVHMTTPQGIPVMDAMCRILEDGDFGTFDALKRTLTAQAGAVGVVRGKSKPPAKVKKSRPRQRELFA